MLKARGNIQVLKVDRRLITLFKPFFPMKETPKWAFSLTMLVRVTEFYVTFRA